MQTNGHKKSQDIGIFQGCHLGEYGQLFMVFVIRQKNISLLGY